ncbi:hypothetical protein [Nocardia sp. NPDC004750]
MGLDRSGRVSARPTVLPTGVAAIVAVTRARAARYTATAAVPESRPIALFEPISA